MRFLPYAEPPLKYRCARDEWSVLRHRVVVARRTALVPNGPGADPASLDGERRREVLDALRAPPHRQREVLTLRYYLDFSEREIADARISQGAVKSHASRGAAALRHLLEAHR